MSEHFIKESFGALWHFCHNREGICFCRMKDEHLAEYEILLSEGQSDFGVIIDDSDCIHLICQNNAGDIIYLNYTKQNWQKVVVMQSKNQISYPKNFRIQRTNKWINIFYIIEYKGQKMLTHQMLERSDVPPTVLDYVGDDYSLAKDSMNNLYVLFYSQSQRAYGYKKYSWNTKKWEEFSKIDVPSTFMHPYLFIDSVDTMHIVGVLNDDVVYYSDTLTTIAKGIRPIVIQKENLHIMWLSKGGIVYGCQSVDGGKNFQNPTEFMAGRFAQTKLFSISYTAFERQINARNCYGFIGDSTVKFYALGEFFNVLKTPPRPIQKSLSEEAREFIQKTEPQPEQEFSIENIELTKLKIQMGHISSNLEKINKKLDEIRENSEIYHKPKSTDMSGIYKRISELEDKFVNKFEYRIEDELENEFELEEKSYEKIELEIEEEGNDEIENIMEDEVDIKAENNEE